VGYAKILPTQLTTYVSTELSDVFKAMADWNGKKLKRIRLVIRPSIAARTETSKKRLKFLILEIRLVRYTHFSSC